MSLLDLKNILDGLARESGVDGLGMFCEGIMMMF